MILGATAVPNPIIDVMMPTQDPTAETTFAHPLRLVFESPSAIISVSINCEMLVIPD